MSLPSFFSSSTLDDAKYENLLADLRAHDLLGPDDFKSSGELFPSGIFSSNSPAANSEEPNAFPPPNVKAPPGFSDTQRGLAPTKADIAWARTGYEFAQLKDEYTKQNHSLDMDDEDDDSGSVFDEAQLAHLGLDDDEKSLASPVISPVKPRPPPKLPPPLPQAPVAPPMPPPMPPGPPLPRQTAPRIEAKFMTPRDVQFILNQQMKQLRSSDPFSDDYYFHNFVQKRSRHGLSPVGPSPGPVPSWQLQHTRAINPLDAKRATKSREWESEHHVLGRMQKSSLYRPRELLANLQSEEESVPGCVFSTKSWSKRLTIEEGMQCLLSLQDARHILDSRGINPQQFHQQDSSHDPALSDLRRKTASLLVRLASVLGVDVSDDPKILAPVRNKGNLYAVLSVLKGKRLACRALPLLHPSARYTLLPMLMEYMMASSPTAESEVGEEEAKVDEQLAQTLVVTMMYHPPLPPPVVLAECIELALTGKTVETLTQVLHNRPRAEALQALLQQGGSLCLGQDSDAAVRTRWMIWQNKFVELASAIKMASNE